ncbi:MAG TPA: hypothetical protein VD834_00735 [Blastococcus sp.]|nr:hypothetical protein [Blastococcus sp.]
MVMELVYACAVLSGSLPMTTWPAIVAHDRRLDVRVNAPPAAQV